jgi:hypothetical protein
MTIIIGAKYNEGVLIGYDTLELTKTDSKLIPKKNPIHKFRQIKDYVVGMGFSGEVDLDFFTQYENLISESKQIIDVVSQKFLRTNFVDGIDAMHMPYLIHDFVFATHDKLLFGTNCNRGFGHVPVSKDFGGIGFGYYSSVDLFFKSKHSIEMDLEKCIQVVKSVINFAKEETFKDPKYNLGHKLSGLGLVNINKNNYEILEFN